MVYIMPLLSFVIPLIFAVVCQRRGLGWLPAALAVIFAVVMGWAIWKGRQHQGWDAIGYAILALLMAAPAILGLGVGSVVGWWQRRRRARGG